MILASIIIGIILVLCGISCLVAPVDTYVSAARLLAFLLLAYGVHGVVRFFKRKALVPEFIVSILAVVIAFVYLFRPAGTPPVGALVGLDRFILTILGLWFLIKGGVTLVFSIKTRYVNDGWVRGFFVGLTSLVVGIYSLAQPTFAATTAGVLIGLCYIQCGLDLLLFGTSAGYFKSAMEELQDRFAASVEEIRSAVQDSDGEKK